MYHGGIPKTESAEPMVSGSQEDLARRRELERKRKLNKEMKEARDLEAWESFLEREMREIELRRNGQLARLLGEPQPGESPEALRRLSAQDQRQAEEGLVTLMVGGKSPCKHIDELTREDMPARIAANALRTTWLKERRDGWLASGRNVVS